MMRANDMSNFMALLEMIYEKLIYLQNFASNLIQRFANEINIFHLFSDNED